MRRWETISASFGVSRSVGRKYCDNRIVRNTPDGRKSASTQPADSAKHKRFRATIKADTTELPFGITERFGVNEPIQAKLSADGCTSW
jgi:hypothetical protein